MIKNYKVANVATGEVVFTTTNREMAIAEKKRLNYLCRDLGTVYCCFHHVRRVNGKGVKIVYDK